MRRGLVSICTPDHTALVTETGHTLSYANLLDDIDRLAVLLEPRTVLFIIGRNDYITLRFYLAALEYGTVPLILDADTQGSHVAHLSALFSPHLILAEPALAAGLAGLMPLTQDGRYTLYCNTASCCPTPHRDLALLATTSGSTGSPKLVRLSLANLTANAAAIAAYLDIGPGDRAVASLPLSYSYGLSVVNSHLHAGAALVLCTHSLMEDAFWRHLRNHAVSSFAGVPYHYEVLLRLGLEQLNVPTLRKMTHAGGRLSPERIVKVSQTCKALGIRFWSMYGQTEAAPRMAYLPPEDTLRKLGSIGRAIPSGRLWIRDEAGADITSAGGIGELLYEGPNVCLGYAHNADDLTRGDDNGGVLYTGDLARCDTDGYFYLEGRLSRFLKIHGKRISLDRVESILTGQGIVCAAMGRDDHLVLQVVDTPRIDAPALRRSVAELLNIHFSAVAINTIADLPRLPTGKVDYQCLAQMQQPG